MLALQVQAWPPSSPFMAAANHSSHFHLFTHTTLMAPASKPVVAYGEARLPPLAVIAVAKLAGVDVDLKVEAALAKAGGPVLRLPSGQELVGVASCIRYLARTATTKEKLYGEDAIAACEVDEWLDRLPALLVIGPAMEAALEAITDYLSLRAYFVGYGLTAADACAWGLLADNMQWAKLCKNDKFAHLQRWFEHVASVPELQAVYDAHSQRKRPALAAKGGSDKGAKGTKGAALKGGETVAVHGTGGGDTGSFDVDLPGAAEGKVVTRFPPEPSGYLHIGHAKAALLNQYFADLYKGKMLMRFDDTNPSKEKDEFVDNIMADVKALGLRYAQLTYTSDYFPQLMDLGRRLIKAGLLYADDTPLEQMREERMAMKESKYRNRPIEETLSIFDEMEQGTEVGLRNCIRFKMDMKSDNGALRDPVAFRCNLEHHWRTGHKYKVYPTYDLACPFVDSLEGVTHALRSSEYRDREEQYYMVLKMVQGVWPGLPDVHLWDFSRLSFVHTVMSKRKLKWFVETGRVDGWDDPRFPTVQGLFRRGLQLDALREFILSQGASKNVTFQEWDKIWSMNKRVVDPVCPRHTSVLAQGRVKVTIENGPATPEVVDVPRHKKHPPAGTKKTARTREVWIDGADAALLADGEEVTLMDWGNCFIKDFQRDAAGAIVSATGQLHLEGSVKSTKWKLTWLPALPEGGEEGGLAHLTLVDFGDLLTKRKLEEDDAFEQYVAEQSRFEARALGDANMRSQLKKGDVLQLERRGYYIVDDAGDGTPGKPMVLFSIPDGRAKK